TASTDGAGHLNIGVLFASLADGTPIVTTATNVGTGDTSEFSAFVSVTTAPMIINDKLTPLINEGSVATLAGQLVDPDVGDVLSLRVNWGDGSPTETFHPGRDPFAVTHRYLDNGTFDVAFTWFDNHGGSNSRTRQVTVTNVAPQLANVALRALT